MVLRHSSFQDKNGFVLLLLFSYS